MTNGIFDLVIMILILAIVVGAAITLIMPLVKDNPLMYEQQIGDKTISKVIGEAITSYGGYDGKMSKLEVILATQVMDWGSPEPRKIKIDDTEINITSTYKNDLILYARKIWDKIKFDSDNTRYSYEYSFENPTDNNDDCYKIVRSRPEG